jgi:DNA-binding XRE family transcriptional regulator
MDNAKIGRPSTYETHIEPYLKEIKSWKLEGFTDEDIAKKLGINRQTFRKFKKEKQAFFDALKKSMEDLVLDVERSLYAKAKGGFPIVKTKEYFVKDNSGKLVLDRVEKTTEIAQPDLGSIVFVLKNKKPQSWQDKREYINNSDFNKNIDMLKDIVAEESTDGSKTDKD